MQRWLIALLSFMVAGAAQAQLNVVATTTSMGMLARTVGGEHVEVRELAPPDRDAHYLQVRPHMMAALRRADLVVAVGGELEIGWLPPAIDGAHNPRIRPGQQGYFEAAAQVELLDAHGIADRALGDVHPGGNPHMYLDPVRMATAGEALAERLARLDAANAEQYRANAAAFAAEVERRLPDWRQRAQGAPGVLLYHEDADYLMELLGVEVHGYLEPVPGVPPTASHLRELVRRLQDQDGVVIYQSFHPPRGPQFAARELDWPLQRLPSKVEQGGDAEAFFALIERWADAVAAAH